MEKQNTFVLIVALVAIVGIVGMVVSNTAPSAQSSFTENIAGEAITKGEASNPKLDRTAPVATINEPIQNQIFPAGTTSATLSVTTNEAGYCKWSYTDQDYVYMTNTMNVLSPQGHIGTLTGLVSGQTYTYYVRCIDLTGNRMTTSVSRTFSVAADAPVIILTPPNNCFDSDGVNINTAGFINGTTNGTGFYKQDFCANGVYVLEHYCVGTNPRTMNASCANNFTTTCQSGRCI